MNLLEQLNIKKKTFRMFKNIKEPYVTLAMLSFRRPNSLIKTLTELLEMDIPLNLVLRVQAVEELDNDIIDEIEILSNNFYGCDLNFTEKNNGTGEPRHNILSRAYNNFNTPFIMTCDDDMTYQKNTLPVLASLLTTKKDFGACSVWCSPNYNAWTLQGNRLLPRPPRKPFDDQVDGMGSATSMFKREVFDTCEYDKEYYIGWADMDLGMQIRKSGWRMGIIHHENVNAVNRYKESPSEYKQIRYSNYHNQRSKKIFYNKWKIHIG